MPLARGSFGPEECERFVAGKERLWQEHGCGPWAFVIDGEFAGWGGIQPEGGDADVGLVLHPKHWGAGKVLFQRIIAHAFAELGQKPHDLAVQDDWLPEQAAYLRDEKDML